MTTFHCETSGNRRARCAALALALLVGGSCSGQIQNNDPANKSGAPRTGTGSAGQGPTQPAGPAACRAPAFAPARVWRLNDVQYMNAVKTLLPNATVPVVQTPGRAAAEFVSWSEQFPVQEAFASQLSDAALNVAEQVGKNVGLAVTCAAAQDGAVCAQGFIDRFASRAFRRPLQPDERAELMSVYDAGAKSGGGFASGVLCGGDDFEVVVL